MSMAAFSIGAEFSRGSEVPTNVCSCDGPEAREAREVISHFKNNNAVKYWTLTESFMLRKISLFFPPETKIEQFEYIGQFCLAPSKMLKESSAQHKSIPK